MVRAEFISAADRDLVRRVVVVLAFIFLFAAAFSRLHLMYSKKFFDFTGRAEWIWAQHRMAANEPVAFFAAREFLLPESRIFTRLKVAGDPEYSVYVNGREVAARTLRSARTLASYDISELVATGRNRIVIAVRAPQGVGGLIASVDIAPEIANWVVTDGTWKIYRRWQPELLVRDVPSAAAEPPMIIGEPPIGRWNFLPVERLPLAAAVHSVVTPQEAFAIDGLIPTIRTSEGIAVAVAERARATVYDFGAATRGRVRVVVSVPSATSRVVKLRFANVRNELGMLEWNMIPVVFAPGERAVTLPDTHTFRYVMLFGSDMRADVLR